MYVEDTIWENNPEEITVVKDEVNHGNYYLSRAIWCKKN